MNLFKRVFILSIFINLLVLSISYAYEGALPERMGYPKTTPENAIPKNIYPTQGEFQIWARKKLFPVAKKKGVKYETFNRALKKLTFLPEVVEKTYVQKEVKFTLDDYLKRIVSKARVKKARQLYKEFYPELYKIYQTYGVPPKYIVALWGIESYFGHYKGDYPILSSLATLTHEGWRDEFFKKEFASALKILQENHVELSEFKGSWAGAMGQSQFMPSTFLHYAVDGNKDGKKDIWNTKVDVFASAANLLSETGWKKDIRWGREVKLTKSVPEKLKTHKIKKNLRSWHKLGVRTKYGHPLPTDNLKASLIQPDGKGGRVFLVYDNFHVLLKWNRSILFACAVGQLADNILH